MLITQKNMSQFTHVIIDEVHERDKDMDFLLILTRKFIVSDFDFMYCIHVIKYCSGFVAGPLKF